MKRRQNAAIFNDVYRLGAHLDACRGPLQGRRIARTFDRGNKDYRRVVMTSGGFDPLHVGHLSCIQASADIANNGLLVVVVNGDLFLKNKKGYAFMDLRTRMEIISAIRGVDYVVAYEHQKDMTVCEPINVIKPNFFTKGGDRNSSTNVPEFDICEKNDCEVIFRVGGGKIQNSSVLISNAMKKLQAFEDSKHA